MPACGRNWQQLGDRAIRFARAGGNPASLVRAIRTWPHVIDVVVARDDIAVYFDRDPVVDPANLAALEAIADDAVPARDHVLRCVYDGVDLDAVARACGIAVADVIERHAASSYIVETMGFSPGFGYLAGLDARLAVPRRATPRPRVSALSVAIAGPYTAVYPFDSPGGWNLIGRVPDQPMFGVSGARLALGDRVRFVPWR